MNLKSGWKSAELLGISAELKWKSAELLGTSAEPGCKSTEHLFISSEPKVVKRGGGSRVSVLEVKKGTVLPFVKQENRPFVSILFLSIDLFILHRADVDDKSIADI